MNPIDHDAHTRYQQQALDPAGSGPEHAEVRAYRALDAAIRQAPMPLPPAGFARSMERLVCDASEQADVELWLHRVLGVCAVLVALAYGVPSTTQVLADAFGQLSVPWPLLGMTAVTLAAVAATDRWLERRSTR